MKTFWTLFFMSLALPLVASAVSLQGSAWSENIGWIQFSGPGYHVDMDENTGELSGDAWSEYVGWIKFNANPQEPFHWARACNGAINRNCTGFVPPDAGGWDGFIKLNGTDYHIIRAGKNGCALRGWVWGSDVLGWIHMAGNRYGVTAVDCPNIPPIEPTPTLPPAEAPQCSFYTQPATVARGGSTNVIWDCGTTADSCNVTNNLTSETLSDGPTKGIARAGSLTRSTTFLLDCQKNGTHRSFTSQVSVLRPIYCEIIPFLGSCR